MKRYTPYSIVLTALAMSMISGWVHAQEKTEKASLKIDLAYYQVNDQLPIIKVTAKTKKEKKFAPVEGVEINLFVGDETAQGFMGRVKTNMHGAGSLPIPEKFKELLDTLSVYKFIGTVTQNNLFEDQAAELEITKAKIELTLTDIDSVRTLQAKVLVFEDTAWVAQPEVEIKWVVRGVMSDLTASDEELYTTDENGETSTEFTLTLPGDATGNIILGAKIDSHDLYGNLASTEAVKWGVPRIPDTSFAERTLWATRDKTPLWLIIFPNLIIAAVWGMIFFLIFQIVRIIKLGRANNSG